MKNLSKILNNENGMTLTNLMVGLMMSGVVVTGAMKMNKMGLSSVSSNKQSIDKNTLSSQIQGALSNEELCEVVLGDIVGNPARSEESYALSELQLSGEGGSAISVGHKLGNLEIIEMNLVLDKFESEDLKDVLLATISIGVKDLNIKNDNNEISFKINEDIFVNIDSNKKIGSCKTNKVSQSDLCSGLLGGSYESLINEDDSTGSLYESKCLGANFYTSSSDPLVLEVQELSQIQFVENGDDPIELKEYKNSGDGLNLITKNGEILKYKGILTLVDDDEVDLSSQSGSVTFCEDGDDGDDGVAGVDGEDAIIIEDSFGGLGPEREIATVGDPIDDEDDGHQGFVDNDVDLVGSGIGDSGINYYPDIDSPSLNTGPCDQENSDNSDSNPCDPTNGGDNGDIGGGSGGYPF